MLQNLSQFDALLRSAIEEDAVHDDTTVRALLRPEWRAEAVLIARQSGIVCGLPLLARTCELAGGELAFKPLINDGAPLRPGAEIAEITGPAGAMLSLERTLLNLLQKLSGIASLTRRFVDAAAGTGAAILDTRKTTPGWRTLEKYSVACGGGENHRMNLREQILIKENHLRLIARFRDLDPARAVAEALKNAGEHAPQTPIGIEVENLAELKTALECEPDIVLLDNMSPEAVNEALACVGKICGGDGPKRPLIEVSGGINLENVRGYAALGVDRISIGSLTHSAPALDIAMEVS